MKVIYIPIESYEERYTFQLREWTRRAFQRNNVDFVTIEGDSGKPGPIKNPGPLDYYKRTIYATTQIAKLVEHISVHSKDYLDDAVLYFQDMFHPGIEALPYIFQQTGSRPKIFVQNCAQSMDIYDFTFPMRKWMRPYELMVDSFVSGVFVASTVHAELMRVANFTAPIYVTGLPFDAEEVRERVSVAPPFRDRPRRVVFTSRWDREKQPNFFMDVVDDLWDQNIEFIILSGGDFRGNDQVAVDRAREMESDGKLRIKANLPKNEYYRILANSRVQFNCAYQDFVSNTLLESSTLGTVTVAPAFRSFPEALQDNCRVLFVPWSQPDAVAKIERALEEPPSPSWISMASQEHSKTLDRVIEIMRGGPNDRTF